MIKPVFKQGYADVIKSFISFRVNEAKAKSVVIGLSGGLDSAVTTKMCVEALGKEKVFCILLPTENTPKEDTEDALEFAKSLGVKYRIINISGIEHPGQLVTQRKRNCPDSLKRQSAGYLQVKFRG